MPSEGSALDSLLTKSCLSELNTQLLDKAVPYFNTVFLLIGLLKNSYSTYPFDSILVLKSKVGKLLSGKSFWLSVVKSRKSHTELILLPISSIVLVPASLLSGFH